MPRPGSVDDIPLLLSSDGEPIDLLTIMPETFMELNILAKEKLKLAATSQLVFTTRYKGHRAVIDGDAWCGLRHLLERIHVTVVISPVTEVLVERREAAFRNMVPDGRYRSRPDESVSGVDEEAGHTGGSDGSDEEDEDSGRGSASADANIFHGSSSRRRNRQDRGGQKSHIAKGKQKQKPIEDEDEDEQEEERDPPAPLFQHVRAGARAPRRTIVPNPVKPSTSQAILIPEVLPQPPKTQGNARPGLQAPSTSTPASTAGTPTPRANAVRIPRSPAVAQSPHPRPQSRCSHREPYEPRSQDTSTCSQESSISKTAGKITISARCTHRSTKGQEIRLMARPRQLVGKVLRGACDEFKVDFNSSQFAYRHADDPAILQICENDHSMEYYAIEEGDRVVVIVNDEDEEED